MPMIEATIRRGPVRATIVHRGAALNLFSKRQANAIIRTALNDGGDYFCRVFIPLRFTNYAKTLGYRVTSEYAQRKKSDGFGTVPFVRTGDTRDKATAQAHTEVTASGGATGKGRIKILVPIGPIAFTASLSQIFRSVPASEVERLARVVGASLDGLLAERQETTNRKGVTRATLPGTSRAALPTPARKTSSPSRRAA
jgi:hypothetical protein